jgi:hypothetical protein
VEEFDWVMGMMNVGLTCVEIKIKVGGEDLEIEEG